jgi:cyclic pyranopterin phosphate synthase
MVDISGKTVTERVATASCLVRMEEATRDRILRGAVPKGDVIEVARIAGIMAAKKTSELIPLCHPIALTSVEVESREANGGIGVIATVRTTDRTGVEMEALTAVAIAGLTIYDMIKSLDRSAEVGEIRLLHKAGGRSGDWSRPT